jgi:hypothetical protein
MYIKKRYARTLYPTLLRHWTGSSIMGYVYRKAYTRIVYPTLLGYLTSSSVMVSIEQAPEELRNQVDNHPCQIAPRTMGSLSGI